MYFRLPAEQRTMLELRSHQGRHQKMEADEASRKDGRCTTRDPAPEKPAKKEQLNNRSSGRCFENFRNRPNIDGPSHLH